MVRQAGLLLLVSGAVLALAGLVLLLAGRLPAWLGHLPGDIHLRGRGWGCSFPIVTCILGSVVLTLLLNLIMRLLRK
jgi:hypothetical protein